MDRDTLALISQLVGQVGFPIFVAVFLLTRLDRSVKELTGAIHTMIQALQHLSHR